MMASHEGHVACVQLLLDRGAQADPQDNVSAVCECLLDTQLARTYFLHCFQGRGEGWKSSRIHPPCIVT